MAGCRLITIRELSETAGVSIPTLNRLKARGDIPFYQPGGKRHKVLFPADAFEAINRPKSESTRHRSAQRAGLSGPKPRWTKHARLRGSTSPSEAGPSILTT